MVSPIAIVLIDGTFNLMKAPNSKFFQFLEFLEIQYFKMLSLIKSIVDDGSVEIIDATFNILFAPLSNQKFLI